MFKQFKLAMGVAILGLGISTNASAALVVTAMNDAGGPSETDLVNTLLSGASGITVNSIAYTGSNLASGTFSGGTGIIGFESGILLTSGDAHIAIGPNNQTGATGDNGLPGSALLDGLIPGYSTHDATLLTIHFTPTGNNVRFDYVFASEEYNEWVGSDFNDVFGFFVNGTNYALIPGTTTPVSINNVNNGANSSFYIDNESAALNTQYDGLTRALSFVAPVKPGEDNVMILGIADAGDWVLDSGVFLKGSSFSVCGGPGEPECEDGDIPEPASLALLGIGLLGLSATRRRNNKI